MENLSTTPAFKDVRTSQGTRDANKRFAELAAAVGRNARSAWDGALHQRRRAAARIRLARAMPVESVLFLCHGNICRSSYAEFAFRRLTQAHVPSVTIASAGFVGPHRPPPLLALEAAGRRGLDMSGHRSRLLTQAMLDASNLIVVMDAAQATAIGHRVPRTFILVLGDLDPVPIERRAIRDPWNTDAAVFDASYRRIDRCLGELANLLAASRAPGPT